MRLLRLLACVCSLSALVPAAFAQGEALYSWDFSRARDAGSFVEVPDTLGGPALRFRESAGLAPDADENGRQVLQLAGDQVEPGRGVGNFPPFPAVGMRVRFRPSSSGPVLQTIVTFGGCYELRYNREKSRVEFIVTYPEKKYYFVHAEVQPDVWNQAVASFKDGRLTLAIGLSRAEGVMPAGAEPVSIQTSFRVGVSGERAFKGSLSEIVITKP